MKNPSNSVRDLFRALLVALLGGAAVSARAQSLPNSVLFVTQVPVRETRNTVTAIGGNHLATTAAAPRGGDLMMRYQDGALKNLTRTAGYGEAGQSQGANSIAVRDPHIHWSGQRALFSMVTGVAATARWQMYEITGLGRYDTPVITRVFSQPANYNNVQPCYTSSDNIIFASDRPRDGSAHLYPARDEEGRGEINTGLWLLNPAAGILTLMEHSPSGSFDPFVDSYGRVVFSRWDHLQRDAVATAGTWGGFDFTSEAPGATGTAGQWVDMHPEALPSVTNPLGLKFDQFLPWTVNQDGTDLVTINHLGRHEMTLGFKRSRPDSNLQDFTPPAATTRAGSFLQIREAPSSMRGRYVSMDGVFSAISAGKVLTFLAPPSRSPATGASITTLSDTGLARDPGILSNGRLMASVSSGISVPIGDSSYGGGESVPPPLPPDTIPGTTTPFKITVTNTAVNHTSPALVNLTTAVTTLNPDSVRSVTNTINGQSQSFTGALWELQPVEVTATTRPPVATTPMDRPELEIFQRAGVSPAVLRTWMTANELAVISCRNVTTRDAADKQQPSSLKVEGGVETIAPGGGPVYTVSSVQFFQADYLRGYTQIAGEIPVAPPPGRRVTARPMHDDQNANPVSASGPGRANVAPDGSMAAFVPARRGLSWHLADPAGNAVVRERYWLSFQAGEIRSCTSCHGVNSLDQAGHGVATNPPEALRTLLDVWKETHPDGAAGSFRVWSEATLGTTLDPAADNDNDGVINLVEYARGSSPLAAPAPGTDNSPLRITRRALNGQENNVVTFTRSLTAFGLETTVESSTDMATWEEAAYFSGTVRRYAAPFSGATRTVNGGEAEEIELARLSSPAPGRRYFRLRVRVP